MSSQPTQKQQIEEKHSCGEPVEQVFPFNRRKQEFAQMTHLAKTSHSRIQYLAAILIGAGALQGQVCAHALHAFGDNTSSTVEWGLNELAKVCRNAPPDSNCGGESRTYYPGGSSEEWRIAHKQGVRNDNEDFRPFIR